MAGSPTRSRAVLACMLALLGAGLLVPPADAAGDLHVLLGALPDGTPAPVGPWSGLNDNAPAGTGTFGVAMGSVSQGWAQTATLSAPANLSFASATALRHYDLPVSPNHSQPQATTSWEDRGHPYAGSTIYGGYPGDSASGSVSVTNPSSLTIRVSCVNFDGVAGSCMPSAYLVDRLDLALHDDEAPLVIGGLGGALVDGTWQTAATSALTVTASDLGSGVYRAFVREGAQTFYALADGAATRCRDARPGNASAYDFVASALTLVPCQTTPTTYTPSFDLTQLGDGTHVVSLGIEDAGGNERTVLTNRTVRVNAPGGALGDPGAPCPGGTYDESGTCAAAAAGGGGGGGGGGGAGAAGGVTPVTAATIGAAPPISAAQAPAPVPTVADDRRANGTNATAAAAVSLRTRRVSVAYGEPVVATGQLTGRGGAPIGGARIALTTVKGRAAVPQNAVITDADGSFRAVIAPGASGTVRFAYRAFADDASDADTADLEIGVRTVAHLRAAPRALHNGDAVRFRGSIEGAPARSRKVIEMQVWQDGRWLTFATTRLHGERFAYRYRFTRTRKTTRYVFRTIVRTEAGWPYETGSSNRVSVEVRP